MRVVSRVAICTVNTRAQALQRQRALGLLHGAQVLLGAERAVVDDAGARAVAHRRSSSSARCAQWANDSAPSRWATNRPASRST